MKFLNDFKVSALFCVFDFSYNCIYYCYCGVNSNAFSLVSCICRHGCDGMAIEYEIESENEDLDLGSVRHNEQDKSA